ncbi:hypothetical protein MRX96_024478 [Rhipicephalus microplus]
MYTMYYFGVLLLGTVFANGLKEPHVVYPRLLEERSSDGAMLIRLHDQLTLSLKKASVAAPEVRVLTEENGKTVAHVYNGEDLEKDLYEDEENIATVFVTKDGQGVYMNGLVGPRHRIEPIPFAERIEENVVSHAIYEIDQPQMMDQIVRHTEQEEKLSERQNGQPPPVPDNVQVEVYFVVDSLHHRHFDSEMALLMYLCVTMNAVDLRFRQTRNPAISFIRETYAVVFPGNHKYMYDQASLEALRGYAYKKAQDFNYPDVVFLLTGRDLYGVTKGNVSVNSAGMGYVAGVCTKSAVAIGEDKAGFYTGVHTVTHELAHVLGAEHDGEGPTYVGHPGAKSCSWYDGNIMSYIDKGPHHNQFSHCSLQQMKYVLTKAGTHCWEVRSQGYAAHSTYPGMVMSQLAYCKEMVQDTTLTVQSYTVSETTCKVRCRLYRLQKVTLGGHTYEQKNWMYQEFKALDYTICGNDTSRVCILGSVRKETE